jgi:hypothetical protein
LRCRDQGCNFGEKRLSSIAEESALGIQVQCGYYTRDAGKVIYRRGGLNEGEITFWDFSKKYTKFGFIYKLKPHKWNNYIKNKRTDIFGAGQDLGNIYSPREHLHLKEVHFLIDSELTGWIISELTK